VDICKDVFY
jgi:hypothetical protein